MTFNQILNELGPLLHKKPVFNFDDDIIIKIFNLTLQMIQKEEEDDKKEVCIINKECIIRSIKMLSFILSSMAKSTSSWSSELIYNVTINS